MNINEDLIVISKIKTTKIEFVSLLNWALFIILE